MKAVLGLVTAVAAMAQQPIVIQRSEVRMGSAPADVVMFNAAGAAGLEFGFTAAMGPVSVVKGAPYSAEIHSESVQTLADGNRIVHKNVSGFYRDSEGRTRRELTTEIPGQEPHKLLLIDDPVASVHYTINLKEKTAYKTPKPKAPAGATADRLFVTSPDMAAGAGVQARRFEWRSANIVSSDQGLAPQSESLGKRVIEGVEAVGTRTVVKVPAGQIGNERELVTVSENWYSEELKTPVLSKRSDPRFGESSTRTINIRRGEQPRYLFEPPTDVKVVENGPMERAVERVHKTIDKL